MNQEADGEEQGSFHIRGFSVFLGHVDVFLQRG